jgi:SAM-dependent methyltransferase
VAELTGVLGQSQPRVSRHLRILADAGLAENFREGRWVFYRLAPAAARATPWLADLAPADDPVLKRDRAAMANLRHQREREALSRGRAPFPAFSVGTVPGLGEFLDEALGAEGPINDVLDIGAGSGTLLCHLGSRVRRGVGIDADASMRAIARARLRDAGLAHCTVRAGDAHALPFADQAFDVVIVDEVLRASERRPRLLAEAARVLRPAGRLLLIERILPAARRLPAAADRDAIYENQVAALAGAAGLRLVRRQWLPGRVPDRALFVAVRDQALERSGTDG